MKRGDLLLGLAVRVLVARGPVAASIVVGGPAVAAGEPDGARAGRLEDFDAFCRFVGADYAYFDLKKTDWPAVCAAYRPAAADAADRGVRAVPDRGAADRCGPGRRRTAVRCTHRVEPGHRSVTGDHPLTAAALRRRRRSAPAP